MSCSPFDLKDYFLRELPDPQRLQVEAHITSCPACREELDRLGLTEAALKALGEEEIPQRIAFVSDPVFELSGWRRWWSAFWNSAPRLGFASAAMVSTAILVSAFTRPAPAPAPVTPASVVAGAVGDRITGDEIDRRIQAAVAESEARQGRKTEQMVKAMETRSQRQIEAMRLAAAHELDYYQRNERVLAASYGSRRLEGGTFR
jgi:anti-sigma factor RsiW